MSLEPRAQDPLTQNILACAMTVHSTLGPGLLETVYEICLTHELRKQGLGVERQMPLPVVYDSVKLDAGFRIDLLVAGEVIVEVKSVDRLAPTHTAQLLTYLRLAGLKTGLLLNFNVLHLRDGIRRVSN
jgi:GxxExxY protein